jgi:hypothetical protein
MIATNASTISVVRSTSLAVTPSSFVAGDEVAGRVMGEMTIGPVGGVSVAAAG